MVYTTRRNGMNRILTPTGSARDCMDFVVAEGASLWLKFSGLGILVYLWPMDGGLMVELIPDDKREGSAVTEITLDSAFASTKQAEKALEEYYKEVDA
jgi:hypothetical protein